MEYRVEELSPVKKKVFVTVKKDEVEAAIATTVALYRTSVQVDGFRKGKVPASVIESRFRDKVYAEAKQDLVNVHINNIIEELKVSPVSGIEFGDEDENFVREQDFAYSISFEVLPTFEIPVYEGMEVEQEKAVVLDSEVEDFIERMRKEGAELVVAEGNGPAVDGQVVEIDFTTYENGVLLEGIGAQNFQMDLGEGQALKPFEDLVKTVALGETKEGDVAFPEDFLAPNLAGKTVSMKVTVHSIKEKKLPEVNDAFAKTLGQESVEKLREFFVETYARNRNNLYKSTAQKKLLDKLVAMTEFDLPESMVDTHLRSLLAERQSQAERKGRSLESMGQSIDEIVAECRKEAEEITRDQVFLMSVARKEDLSVEDGEVDMAIYQMAKRSGQDFKQLRDDYVNSGSIFILRDRILADKAIDAIYDKAKVNEVDAVKSTDVKDDQENKESE